MDFLNTYTKAKGISQTVKCYFAKMLGAKVVTPLGRILLTSEDYRRIATATGNSDMIDET